jgi:hypothetical protein
VWDLTQHKLLWEQEYEGYGINFSQFISWEGKECLLLTFDQKAIIVSQETGDILGEFQYIRPGEQNLPPYGSRFYSSKFSTCPFSFAYNQAKRWLTCGEFVGRRVRIYSIDPPYPLLREFSADLPPQHTLLGGAWMVGKAEVNGNGRYLTVEYEYSGRNIVTACFPCEVYDTDTWELVWYENRAEVYEVTVSPNGKKIAFLRGKMLEIGDFAPSQIEIGN